MRTYIIEFEDITCIIRAKSKSKALDIFDESFNIANTDKSWVKKMPKKGIIYETYN